jgi:hypothetical protein
MTPTKLFIAAPVALLVASSSAAHAGKTVEEAGALVCVTEKWDEKEVDKGHKLADFALRCGAVPDDPAQDKYAQACAGKYEAMPDGSWKTVGACTNTYKSGDTSQETYEEGSHLKAYTYQKTGGTGKYAGASGGGTYMYEGLTDAVFSGRYKGQLTLP